jgi:site-specific recombinase XerD
MPRGRPRLHDPSIPSHIDQAKIPRGAYWSRADRVWYTIITEGGSKRRRKIAGTDARLSDLHALLEDVGGVDRHSLIHLCNQYRDSTRFKTLAANTRKDYDLQRELIVGYKLKSGRQLASVKVSELTVPAVQRLIDKIAGDTPTKANHLHRYLRMLFAWGIRRGHCTSNPAKGVEQAKERQRRRLPTTRAQNDLLAFAKAGAALKAHTKGSLPAAVWIAMELTYLCRLRGIEAITLTDAHATELGSLTNRRKGSRDSLVRWSPRLKAAWDAAQAVRKAIWERRHIPTPLRPEDRPLLVNQLGQAITPSGRDTLWQTFIKRAIAANIITADQRFGLHDLKRKATTDTKGREAKLEGGGWKEESMLEVYDMDIPEVDTPGGV